MELCVIPEENGEPDTVLCYIRNFVDNDEAKKLFNIFSNENFLDSGNRSQKWFQTNGKYFCDKWKHRYPKWNGYNYTNELDKFQTNILEKLRKYKLTEHGINIPNINSCLINKYDNGTQHIGPHRDTPLSFGKYPTIINLSLGATRELLFKNIKSKEKHSFLLESGSLFIMSGSSQLKYTHEITKDDLITKPRISFTLREFI